MEAAKNTVMFAPMLAVRLPTASSRCCVRITQVWQYFGEMILLDVDIHRFLRWTCIFGMLADMFIRSMSRFSEDFSLSLRSVTFS